MSSKLDWSLRGQVVLTGTSAAPTSNYFALHVIADAVISSVTFADGYEMTGSWIDLGTLNAGCVIAGRFKTLTLASGKVILHKE
jgi:hypothetical protein